MFDIIKQNYFKGRLKNNLNNNMNKNNKGFTLIELLVVIAIIGILAGLIIVSLGDATNQAKEAKIKSALDQLRPIAQIHANANGNKFTGLDTNTKVINIYNEIVLNGGTALNTGLHVLDTAWSAYSTTPAGNCICLDSTGQVKETTGTSCATTATVCP
ncbi:MAG: prepilin-type N-terminal cleavage/methylation domain-containing protein [Candidatus Pacebacteria bacterium]|nr:prepilin-type N-terminal cleavage/methylation domain-containing protein [Candidatus Paceibacterota bacterium]